MSSCSNHNTLSIGHRGAKGYVAENTLESINKAIELGVDGIEIDIFKCLTNELVLFHDKDLKELTGESGLIENLTIKELEQFLVLGKYKIPTLTDVLTRIEKPLFVNIELKGLNTAQATSKIIKDLSKNSKIPESTINSIEQNIEHLRPEYPFIRSILLKLEECLYLKKNTLLALSNKKMNSFQKVNKNFVIRKFFINNNCSHWKITSC